MGDHGRPRVDRDRTSFLRARLTTSGCPFVPRQEESTMTDKTGAGVIQLGYRAAWAAILLALPPAVAGCADHVQSSLATCPCSQETTCCSSGVCAASESACGQATSALSNESAGHWT